MERKIGEIFEYNGEWYQCVEGRCKDCHFSEKRYLCKQFIVKNFCLSGIIFKKLEKIGGPYDDCGTILQRFKIYTNVTNADTKGLELHIYSNNTVGIEIKQNKEDMEEKKIQHYDCFFDKEQSKPNLKPFSLEAAKAGKPVYTRDGRKARIICFDAKRKDGKKIIALVPSKDYPGFEDLIAYPNNGNYHGGHENDGDLMMLPEKRIGWININKDAGLFKSKEEAERDCTKDYATVRVEFEI